MKLTSFGPSRLALVLSTDRTLNYMGGEHFIPCCTIGGHYVITIVIVGHDAICSNEISLLRKTGYES